MSRFIHNTVIWWPAIIRAVLICVLAYMVAFDSSFDSLVGKLVEADTTKWGGWRWFVALYPIFGKPILAAVVALKSFMDDTWGKVREKSDTMQFTKV